MIEPQLHSEMSNLTRVPRVASNWAEPAAKSPGVSPREKHLFPINQNIRFECMKGNRLLAAGVGRTVAISSHEVHFTARDLPKPRTRVRLALEWPVLLDSTCPMTLEIHGSVIPGAPGTAAIRIARYEFRTRAARHGKPQAL